MMENERSLYKDLESILYTKEQLAQAVHELGVRITRDYEAGGLCSYASSRARVSFSAT